MLKINDITVQYENNNPTIEGFNLEVGQKQEN